MLLAKEEAAEEVEASFLATPPPALFLAHNLTITLFFSRNLFYKTHFLTTSLQDQLINSTSTNFLATPSYAIKTSCCSPKGKLRRRLRPVFSRPKFYATPSTVFLHTTPSVQQPRFLARPHRTLEVRCPPPPPQSTSQTYSPPSFPFLKKQLPSVHKGGVRKIKMEI